MSGRPRRRGPGDRARRPLIVPVFIPHAGCPHRCAFCNQAAVTGGRTRRPDARTVAAEVRRALAVADRRRFPVQIAFFGGNFLGLEAGRIAALLSAAEHFVKRGRVHGLRFSTRPDTVSEAVLDVIRPFTVSTVEIGAQSMDDRVLEASGRGHGAAATAAAVKRLRRRGIEAGIQLMVGLPEETEDSAMASARRVAALEPAFVRIYPTVVLRGSLLARWYRRGRYRPLSLSEAVSRTARLFRFFLTEGIPVIRMGLQADPCLEAPGAVLAGPYHPAFGHLVLSEHFLETAASRMESERSASKAVRIRVHPRSASRIRGLRNDNLRRLQERFDLTAIGIEEDIAVPEYDLVLSDAGTGAAHRAEGAATK